MPFYFCTFKSNKNHMYGLWNKIYEQKNKKEEEESV